MDIINQKYHEMCITPSDIHENLHILKKYAEQSDFIVELGVRKIVSTWALLAGHPKQLISVDICHPLEYGANIWEVVDATTDAGIEFDFIQKSSLEIDLPAHDMMFIDTLHTKAQLEKELARHHSKVRKFIGLHDTGHADLPEMRQCVNEFLDAHPEWEVAEHVDRCSGLTILKRI